MFTSNMRKLISQQSKNQNQGGLRAFAQVISQKSQVMTSSQQQPSQQILKQNLTGQGDKITRYHDHYRYDSYNDIRHDKKWQQRIIKREDEIFEKWVDLTKFHYDQWRKHVFGRGDPQIQSIPEKYGEYVYFLQSKEFSKPAVGSGSKNTQQNGDANRYEVYCRHKHELLGTFKSIDDGQKATETVFDLEEVPFLNQRTVRKTLLDKMKLSDDHSMAAFTLDIGNTEKLTGCIKDLKTGEYLLNVKLEGISQIEFGGDNDTIFYVETDEMNRPCKVKQLNIKNMKEQTVFVDTNPTHYIDITVTKDKKFLIINSSTKEDSEVWILERKPSDKQLTQSLLPTRLIPRRVGVKAHIDHLRDFFIMISNYGVKSKNYKLTTLNDEYIFKKQEIADQQIENNIDNQNSKDNVLQNTDKKLIANDFQDKWEDLLGGASTTGQEGFIINEFDGFKDFIAIYVRNQGRPEILIMDLNDKKFNSIVIDQVGEIIPGLNQDYETSSLRYQFTSPFVYQQIYQYEHQTKAKRLIKEYKLVGSPQIVRNNFEFKQMLVPSHDGEEVPMNIYYKKGLTLNRKNRVLLEAYGAYGLNLSQGFNIVQTSAMEKGWVIAQAMVRGGGEKGIYWHEQGKLNKKHNSFKDFQACAEYLISQRITHPNLLAARGASAGGTLVAQSCLNLYPELFRACVLNVPFLDMLSSLLDDTLPLAVTDYLEFGNPITDAEAYKQINSYSPYENLSHKEYPATLMNISLNDPRVPAWSSLKFVEKLRDLAQDPKKFPDFGAKNIVVRFNKEGGHFGHIDNDTNLAMDTFEFAWLDYIMFKKNNDL